jgi:gamma-glutamylcyclotransferase (GGCT)/AIG2-like uncharacterized protein YtfP
MKSESSTLNVFVYGTLKPGEANYLAYCEGRIASQTPAYIRGDLYHLSVGYPAITPGDNQVYGVLLTFFDPSVLTERDTGVPAAYIIEVLTSLDRLEDYQPDRKAELNEYNRRLVTVYNLKDQAIAQAWTYFMTLAKVRQYQGKRLSSGNWSTVDHE